MVHCSLIESLIMSEKRSNCELFEELIQLLCASIVTERYNLNSIIILQIVKVQKYYGSITYIFHSKVF